MLDGVFNHTAWDAVMGQGGVDLGYASSASDSMPGTRPSWYSYYNDYGLPATYYDDVYTNDIAVAPDRGDFGKWDDTADVFYGRYSALVRQNPDDNSDYLNEDDQYEYSAMTTNTMDLWKYFGHYVKFWLEKTGHSLTNAYDLEQDNRGIDGLRCDFGQGLPPQFWEYFINYARSMKWNFVFMAETLDGGVPGYRSNRHFDILNESILFTFNNSSADASTFKSALESRRSSYNGGTILLNQSSHDETMPSADAWRTASFYGAINAVDGVPMLFSGQEWGIQPSSGEFGGANQGYALYESNFGKWIPHFKQWNKATFWETHPANSAGLAQWHGYVNRARLGSPALRSLNRYFLNDMAGNYDNGIFSVAKYENAYGSPSTSDVVLAFAVILGDPHAEDSQTYDVDPCFDLLGLDTGTYYNVRNLAAADTNSYLWETARSGQDLRDNGIYIAFTAGVSGNITNDGALVQYLKVCIISPPDAPTVNPASATNDTHFTASWNTSDTATNYVLDVSAASDFGSFVGGFEALDVGDVTSASVTGLTADTTYYYRLRAQNVAGLSGYSATQAVTTILVVTTPTIDTPTQADITCTTATLGATLQDNGNATVTNYGIVWATSETPTLADNVVQESTTEPSMPDVFTVPVTGLPDGTTIYYRGYAMNTNGTGYSTVDSFTTLTLPQGANPDSANATTAYIGDTVTINAKSWQNWETVNARSYAQIHGRWDNADLTSGTTTGAGRDPGSSTDELYANTPQFTQAGTFYWAMMISYQEGNDFYYWQDSASWHKLSESLPDTAAQSITVSVIPVPSDQTATRSVSSPDSAIDLGWRRNSAPHDVLIVRKTAAQSWTEPAAGVTYNADDSIGDGIVVYRGSATNLSDTGLTSGTTYDYKFYSENYSYYSAGVTAQAGTRGAVSAVWDGETSGIMTLGANWNPNGAPATGTDVNLYFNSGVTCYNVTNDYTADEDFGGIFFNSDTAYTLTGNAFQLYEKLENSNTAAVTVSADITLNGATKTEINPVGGDITLAGAVDTAGKNLEVYGSNSKVLQINGAVTGSGDLYVKQKSLVKMSSASDYGDTYVEAGEFWINEGGSAGSASDTITVGGSDTNVIAKLWIADMDGGTTVSQQLAVTSGTGTNRMIGGLHTAGTNAYSGDISVTDAMELYTVAGGTLNVGGTISGSGAEVAKSGEGKLRLTGASTFTGPLYINAGTALVVNAGNPLQAAEVILGSAFNSWNTALQIGDGTTLTNRIVLRESSGGQGTQTIENVSGDAVAAGELRIEYAPTTPGKELILNGAGSSLDFSGGWNLCGTQRGVRVLGNVEVSGALTNGFTDGNQYRGLVKRGSGTLKLDGILGVRFYQDEGDVIVGSNCTFSGVDTYYLGTRDNDDYTAGDTFLTFRDAQTFSNGIVVGTLGAAPGTRQINFQNTQGLVKVSGAIVLGTNLNQYLVLSNDTANAELSGDISGSGGLIKQGAGTITFSANATYASKTTVSEGELLLNTITNTADVEVNTGARLVGRGAVGNLDVTGQIGPGTTNLVGTLSCTNLLMHDGATLDISMSSAGSSKLALLDGGDVTFDEGSTITVVLTNYGGGSLFQDMVILDYTGGSSFGNPNWVLTGEIPEAMEPYVSITNEGHSYWYIKGANPDCSISNGLTTVADGDEVHITAETVSGMEYDLIYVDAANYSDSLSNQWQFAQTLTAASSTTLFTNSLAGLAAGNHRFFRISPLGAWSNDYGKYASAEIFVAKKITLYPGRNWVAMPCLPPSATMSNVFGYQLPAAGSQLSATTIYLYSNGSSMTATNTLWHQTGNHWIESGQPADNKSLSSVQGMVVDLPGSETHTFTLIGALRTNTQSFVIQGGGAMSFVGAVLPAAMHPKDLGLLASGFTGGSRAMRSDRLYLWNRSAQRVNASGWMWYNTSLSKWCYDDGSVLSDSARPCGSDDALLICTEASAEDWTWNIPVFYTSPTTDMAP
jgi:autotransporter-associated beta strand protein